jgi:addiction module HigA family antidote
MSNRDETSRGPFTHMPAVHPGHVLREETLPQLKMSVTAIAQALGVSRQTLHSILAERKAVTVEMALRLGRFLGTSPDLWINLQVNYDKQRLIQKIDLTAIPVCDQLAAT